MHMFHLLRFAKQTAEQLLDGLSWILKTNSQRLALRLYLRTFGMLGTKPFDRTKTKAMNVLYALGEKLFRINRA